ncbi:MAG: HNH endonuclease [Anaerolineaceae bacterium]|nr:HNH endonuclease [Anaerolineaceae bacterium]
MTASVLVLNANYEPINICNYRRAIGLILSDKAIMIENGRGTIHTARTSLQLPSVIRLQKMIRRPRPTICFSRTEIFRRDNFTCQYCGRKTRRLTIDHIIPRSRGGSNTWENVVTSCPVCNHRKGGKLLEETNMRLVKPIKAPPNTIEYIFGRNLDSNKEWVVYLKGW